MTVDPNTMVDVDVKTRVGKKPTPIDFPAVDFTVKDLVATTGLTAAAIHARITPLISGGLVKNVGFNKNNRGRPTPIYRYIQS